MDGQSVEAGQAHGAGAIHQDHRILLHPVIDLEIQDNLDREVKFPVPVEDLEG